MEPLVDWAKRSVRNTAAVHANAKIGWPNLDDEGAIDEGAIWAPLAALLRWSITLKNKPIF